MENKTVKTSGQVQLVVAKYREDVSWLEQTPYPAVVYDKSGRGEGVPLPNIGRESHTYLSHIVRNYPDFPDHVAFLQGDPFKHMGPGANPARLNEIIAECVRKKTPFKGLAFYKLKCDHLGRPHSMRDPESRGKWPGFGQDIPVGRIYSLLFKGPVPLSYHVRGPAGLFVVSRERILVRPKGLYQAGLRAVEADPLDEMNTGHAFERLWYIVFNGLTRLNKDSYE